MRQTLYVLLAFFFAKRLGEHLVEFGSKEFALQGSVQQFALGDQAIQVHLKSFALFRHLKVPL